MPAAAACRRASQPCIWPSKAAWTAWWSSSWCSPAQPSMLGTPMASRLYTGLPAKVGQALLQATPNSKRPSARANNTLLCASFGPLEAGTKGASSRRISTKKSPTEISRIQSLEAPSELSMLLHANDVHNILSFSSYKSYSRADLLSQVGLGLLSSSSRAALTSMPSRTRAAPPCTGLPAAATPMLSSFSSLQLATLLLSWQGPPPCSAPS